jgi:hypothetical protein
VEELDFDEVNIFSQYKISNLTWNRFSKKHPKIEYTAKMVID